MVPLLLWSRRAREEFQGQLEAVRCHAGLAEVTYVCFWLPCHHCVPPPQRNRKVGQPCGLRPLLSQVSRSSPMKSQPILSKTATSRCEGGEVEKQQIIISSTVELGVVWAVCIAAFFPSISLPVLYRVHTVPVLWHS